VARGVAPYARDSRTKDVARGRGSGDAAKRERTAKHTFHTEAGRQVHVEVIPVGETYLAIFEVAEDVEHDLHGEPISNTCGELWLHWGMHREWLDEWMSLPEIPAGSQYVEGDEARRAPRFGQNTAATRTPLVRDGDRSTVVYRRGFPLRFARAKFEIPSYYAPLEMNFVLVEKKPPRAEFPSEEGEESEEGAVAYDMPKRKHPHDPPAAFAVPVGAARGCPYPLGASRALELGPTAGPGWCNFALHTARAAKVTLFLQWRHGDGDAPETMELALNPSTHRTGDVWHVALPVGMPGAVLPMPSPGSAVGEGGDPARGVAAVLYGWKVDGDVRRGGWRFHPGMVLLDPRASSLVPPLGPFPDAFTTPPKLLGSLADVMNGDDANAFAVNVPRDARVAKPRLRRSAGQEVAYELNVSDFTAHLSFAATSDLVTDVTDVSFSGTYEAALEKADHIVNAGATTVVLLPVQASARRTRDDNFGQAPISVFAPDPALASPSRGEPAHQLRALVRGLQRRGLEVLAHVQITHLCEGSDEKPDTSSLRGIDAESYYQLGPDGRVEMNGAVAGATALNPCSAVTQRLLIDALRHWRVAIGLDGFIVDSGGGIARGAYGVSTLLEAIANDPVLGGGGAGFAGGGAGNGGGVRLYLTPGEFEVGAMQSWGVWGERVTPAYARDVGAFLEGRHGTAGGFAARVCGSADLIKGDRGSARGHVMNSFVAPPFGKTLADFAGAAAMRAKISPEAAAVHDRSKDAASFRGGAVGGKSKNASAGAGYGVGTREPGASVTSGRAPPKKLPPLPPTPGETALMLRLMLATLFLSDGTPVVAAGDEYGHSLRGHDDAPWAFKHDANAFRWDAIGAGERGGEITRFMAACAAFRRRRADLFAAGGANVSWSDLGGQRAPAWESADAPAAADVSSARRGGARCLRPWPASAIGGETREAVVTQDAGRGCGTAGRASRARRSASRPSATPGSRAGYRAGGAGGLRSRVHQPRGAAGHVPRRAARRWCSWSSRQRRRGCRPTAEQVEAARAAAERRARRIPDAARAGAGGTRAAARARSSRGARRRRSGPRPSLSRSGRRRSRSSRRGRACRRDRTCLPSPRSDLRRETRAARGETVRTERGRGWYLIKSFFCVDSLIDF
jgi:pullulanase/glycogen debranching enzyme